MVTLLTSCLLDWKSAGTPHARFLTWSPGQEVRPQRGGAWRKTSDASSILASELFDLQQQQSFSPNFAKFSVVWKAAAALAVTFVRPKRTLHLWAGYRISQHAQQEAGLLGSEVWHVASSKQTECRHHGQSSGELQGWNWLEFDSHLKNIHR